MNSRSPVRLPPNLKLFETRDGSPTLIYQRADGMIEHMHHSAGALAESLYIYRDALERTLPLTNQLNVISVGLGLGYNELLTIAALERTNCPARIHSFEAISFLRDQFRRWAQGDANGPLAGAYNDIAARVNVSAPTVKRWLDDGRLELRGEFPAEAADLRDATLVYFDAYSNQMDPHLWDEDTLVDTFGRTLAPTCVLASYAATSALNRVLARLGLVRQRKAGFYMKRQSTLAIRVAPDPRP